MTTVTVPVLNVIVEGLAPTTVVAVEPNATLPVSRPEFVARVNIPSSQVRLVITGPTSLTITDDSGESEIRTRPDTDLADGAYTWYAQRFNGTTWAEQSPTVAFTIDTAATTSRATIDGSLSIDASTPALHLWFVDPPSGAVGDTVTVVGHGFTPTVAVTLAGAAADSGARVVEAASSNAYTDDRQINPLTGVVDCEHHTATVVVPDVPLPGGTLIVDRI